VRITFAPTTCQACSRRHLCTRSATGPRSLSIRPRLQHEALHKRRDEQQQDDWLKRYGRRAGVEGTLSQGIRACGLRRSRYVGLAKAHLQHVLTAAAMNIASLDAWFQGLPRAQTRRSTFQTLMRAA